MGFLQTVDGNFLQTAPPNNQTPGNWIVTADATLVTLATPTNTGELGTAYSSSVAASGGTPPYAYSVIDGALPTSLSLNAVSGAITGTPTVTGTFTFSILVTDAALGTMISTFFIVITSAPEPGSGVYQIIENQTFDRLYTTIPNTTDVKFPNMFVEGYLIGDE